MMLLEYALHTWMPKMVINKHQYIILWLRSFMIETLFTLFLFCVFQQNSFSAWLWKLSQKSHDCYNFDSFIQIITIFHSSLLYTKQNHDRVKSFHYDESWNLSHSHIFFLFVVLNGKKNSILIFLFFTSAKCCTKITHKKNTSRNSPYTSDLVEEQC